MSDLEKQGRIEELLRKSFLGEELVSTQFHLFSARSSASNRVLKPRALCAHNDLLAKSSKYFLDLFSSDIHPSDSFLIDLMDDNDIPSNARIDEYGYGSDSDLDDCNDPEFVSGPELSVFKDGDELSDDGSESVSSDMFVMCPEEPGEDRPSSVHQEGTGTAASSETAVQDTADEKTSGSQTAIRLRYLGNRHVFVKDTVFRTSTIPAGQPHLLKTSSSDQPRCSAKSMYRLASKVGLCHLRNEALTHVRSNLTAHNIIQELSCSLVSTHAELLEIELDVLYSHIASPPVIAEFPVLARRIASKKLSHGADIIIGIHARLLKASQPAPSKLLSLPSLPSAVASVEVAPRASDATPVKDKSEPGPPPVPRSAPVFRVVSRATRKPPF